MTQLNFITHFHVYQQMAEIALEELLKQKLSEDSEMHLRSRNFMVQPYSTNIGERIDLLNLSNRNRIGSVDIQVSFNNKTPEFKVINVVVFN